MNDLKLDGKSTTCIFWLTFWFAKSYGYDDDNTALIIKKDLDNYRDAKFLEADNFTDLVIRSDIYMDNSMFIKEILSCPYKNILIVCPNAWGKTTNLHMLKIFLEIQMNDDGREIMPKSETRNYKLFVDGEIALNQFTVERTKPFLIARNEQFIQKYLGQYPVIYVQFTNVGGRDYAAIEQGIRGAIARAYEEHETFITVFEREVYNYNKTELRERRKNYDKFCEYLEANASADIAFGINFLARVLHESFNQTVVVLIDDYDAPIHSLFHGKGALVENDITKTLDLLKEIGINLLRNDIRHCLHRQVITGKYTLHNPWVDFKRHYIIHTNYANDSIRDYFGFNEKDVRLLLSTYGISHEKCDQVDRWYNGYVSVMSGHRLYDPISIVNFLHKQEIGIFWKESNLTLEYIRKVIQMETSSTIRSDMLALISQQTVLIDEKMGMNLHEIFHLRKLIDQTKPKCGATWFFSFLCLEGLLIRASDDPKQSRFRLARARVPNCEVAFVMSYWLISYYTREYQMETDELTLICIRLQNVLSSEFATTIPLQESLTNLYTQSASLIDKVEDTGLSFGNEDRPRSVFNCVVLHLQNMMKFQIDVYYNRIKKADFVIVNDVLRTGGVIELVYNDTIALNAFDQTERYKEIFKTYQHIEKITLIGISISLEKKVHIITKRVEL